MADPWNFAGPVAQLDSTAGVVTLVDESTFAISERRRRHQPGGGPGPVLPGHPDPLPASRSWSNGVRTEPLAAVTDDPFSATFVSRCPRRRGPGRLHPDGVPLPLRRPGHARGPHRSATSPTKPALCTVELFVDSDFADLFAVKEGRAGTDRAARSPQRWTTGAQPSCGTAADGNRRRRRSRTTRRRPAGLVHLPAGRRGPGRGDPVRRRRQGESRTWPPSRSMVPARGRVVAPASRSPRSSTGLLRPPLPVRPAGRPGHPDRAAGPVAPAGAPGRDRPPGPEGGHRPQQRGPRRPAHLRPRLPRAGGGGRRCPVVHDRVRPRLAC